MGLVGCMLSPIANQISRRLSEDRGFRPPTARLARHDQPQPGQLAQLLADLRLRHLLAPHELADPRRGPFRPLALADRRQRRRHDPPRRHAGLRRQPSPTPASRPRAFCPSYGLAEATLAVSLMPPGEGIRIELVEETELSGGDAPATRNAPAATAPSSIAASRSREWRSRSADAAGTSLPTAGSAGSSFAASGHARLFPRSRNRPTPAWAPTIGSTPATWATCRAATSSSSAAPRT